MPSKQKSPFSTESQELQKGKLAGFNDLKCNYYRSGSKANKRINKSSKKGKYCTKNINRYYIYVQN
jgi:hypothetical protein